jgi:hypothetical protein
MQEGSKGNLGSLQIYKFLVFEKMSEIKKKLKCKKVNESKIYIIQ